MRIRVEEEEQEGREGEERYSNRRGMELESKVSIHSARKGR